MAAALPAEALPTPLPFGSPLLVSIPGSAIAGLRLPGSLFGAGALREAALPPGLRAAIALVSQEAATRGVSLRFVARPEIFTHGRALAWLGERAGGARDHLAITDGSTLRTIPGLRNHLFFCDRGIPAQEAALRRLLEVVPELFAGLASQVNGALAFRCGAAWHRPPPLHLRLHRTPGAEAVERFAFRFGDDPEVIHPHDPPWPDGPLRYVPLTATALADPVFVRMLAAAAARAAFGGAEALVLELPDGPSTAERLAAAMRALSVPGAPRGTVSAVQFVTAWPRTLRPDSVLLHPGTAFWRHGMDFFGAAGRVEVAGGASAARFRNLLAGWLGRPVALFGQDGPGGAPRVTRIEAP